MTKNQNYIYHHTYHKLCGNIMADKITHYQVALQESTMDKLKEKTGEKTATGALTASVDHILSSKGSLS